MNEARFTGYLVRDPETKIMKNGKPRCTYTLAVQRDYRNKQGDYEADFIMFTAYEKRAELVQRYLAKGRKVLVSATVRTGSYTRDDKRVFTTEFVTEKIEFLSSSKDDKPQENESCDAETQEPNYPEAASGYTTVADDDLPF